MNDKKILTLTPSGGNDTARVQAAIDECFLAGGGEVYLTGGRFTTGGVRLRSHVTLHIGQNTTLKGTRVPTDYDILRGDRLEPLPESDFEKDGTDRPHERFPGCRWCNGLVHLVDATDAHIIGDSGALIDGSNCYDPDGEEHYRGPHAVMIYRSHNCSFRNYKVKDSSNWAHAAFFCTDLTFSDLTIFAGHDGIHPTACDHVLVENCDMRTGDDCVAGYDVEDMEVRNCRFNTACSVFRLGGHGIHIHDCVVHGPAEFYFRGSLTKEEKIAGADSQTNGRKNTLSLFTYYADPAVPVRHTPGDILVENCLVENTDRFLHYNFSGNEIWQSVHPLSGITFRSVIAHGLSLPICAYGSPDEPLTLHIENCLLSFRGTPPDVLRAAHYREISLKNVIFGNTGDAPIASYGGDGEIIREDVLHLAGPVRHAEEAFYAQPI